MKRHLQLWHLIFLFAIPVLYTVLKLNSDTFDYIPNLLGKCLIVFGSVWSAYIVVMTVRRGDKEGIIKDLLNEYRIQLNKNYFLAISNIILLVVTIFLVYQIVFFRQIEFNSSTDAKLILSDETGKSVNLGVIRKGQPTKVRLRIGKRHLAAVQNDNSDQITALDPIEVPSWWSNEETPSIFINFSKPYSKLEEEKNDKKHSGKRDFQSPM